MEAAERRITVASRIDRLPLSSLHRWLSFVLGIGTFFDLYDIFLGGLLGAVLTPLFHLSTFETALIIGSGFFGMFVGAIVLGVVSDYIGRRSMYMIDLLIYSLFSLIAAFAPNFIWVVIFRFLAGIGLGAEPPLTDIYMGEMIPRHARGRYTAWCYTLGFFGVPLAGFVGRFVVKGSFLGLDGWRWLLIVGSLGALIVWLLRRNLPESPRWHEIRQDEAAANAALASMEEQIMREHGLKELPEPQPVVVEPQTRATIAEIFSGVYAKRTIMLWIFQILQTVGYYGFGSLAPVVLTAKGFSVVTSLGYTALSFLGYPLGSFISIFLVERVERKWLIVVSALLIALFGLSFGFATSAIVLVISGFLLTTVSNIFSNAFHIYQAEIFPTRMRGTAVGIAYSLSRLVSAILPFAALPVLKSLGPVAVFAGEAVLLVLLCLDVALLGPRSTGRTLEIIAR
ncbi:MFS transporter [Thermogemmatispora aurantia]|jgi:putative MFS transporter|uniref:MFS transporter n=1 Tax=Thermogemmatispora aurantia TaxID=2045279 RepID=UPI00124ED6DD|nr:MFS transporter [Thermogemmatispora aurantia]GER85528.1 MFS transporter [Thermogemmatispora aurantia]